MFQDLKTEWKLFGIVLLISVIISGAFAGFLILTQQEPQQIVVPTPTSISTPEIKILCDWKPEKEDYGPCEAILGTYYDGKMCIWLSGCDTGGEKIPFETIESCEAICKQFSSPIDTSNWQTYRNEEFRFELKYPEDWEVKGNGVVNVVTGSMFLITKNNNPDNLSLDEWFRDATLIGGRPTVKAAAKSIMINGVEAYRFYNNLPPPALYFEIVAIANSQRNIFSIYGDYKTSEDAIMLDQILSTFRFVGINNETTNDGVPSGYNSKIIQVKFNVEVDLSNPESFLSDDLQDSMESMQPLFTAPIVQGNAMLKRWFRVTLKESTDAVQFMTKLQNLNIVETAEFAPLPAPPP